VLRADPVADDPARLRVYLREFAPSSASQPGEADQKALDRLLPAAILRDSAAASDRLDSRTGTASPIGLNQDGVPFTVSQ
jgi:hypothetical protein